MVKDDMLFLGGAFDKKGAYRLTSVAEVKKSLFRGQDVELWGNKGNY
jgi:hypothetical protein